MDVGSNTALVRTPVDVVSGNDGSVSVDLWPNANGFENTHYDVRAYANDENGEAVIYEFGKVQVPEVGPADLAKLLGAGVLRAQGVEGQVLDAAIRAETAAQSSRASADEIDVASLEGRLEDYVDEALTPLGEIPFKRSFLGYDGARHTKETLTNTYDRAFTDTGDRTRTKWIRVPGQAENQGIIVPRDAHLASNHTSGWVALGVRIRTLPGFYEEPQYATDVSKSGLQMIITAENATHEEIEKAIVDYDLVMSDDLTIAAHRKSEVLQVPCFDMRQVGGDALRFASVWARFFNEFHVHPGATNNSGITTAQHIMTFGGNTAFTILEAFVNIE